jgi:hypothetical protein
MRRDLERRLARVELNAYAISCADRQAARHRQSLRTQVNLHQLIRERLQLMGIDPALQCHCNAAIERQPN